MKVFLTTLLLGLSVHLIASPTLSSQFELRVEVDIEGFKSTKATLVIPGHPANEVKYQRGAFTFKGTLQGANPRPGHVHIVGFKDSIFVGIEAASLALSIEGTVPYAQLTHFESIGATILPHVNVELKGSSVDEPYNLLSRMAFNWHTIDAGGRLPTTGRKLFEQMLAQHPEHPAVGYFGGLHWNKLIYGESFAHIEKIHNQMKMENYHPFHRAILNRAYNKQRNKQLIGTQVPGFELTDASGDRMTNASFEGNMTMFLFIDPEVSAAARVKSNLDRYRRFSHKALSIVFVMKDKASIDSLNPPKDVLGMFTYDASSTLHNFINGNYSNLLIDGQGKIIAVGVTVPEWEEYLQSL